MIDVAGYELDPERSYDPDTNMWAEDLGDGRARIGFDPLGAETTGDIVAISPVPTGTRVARGEPLATIEAAKFVGPLAAPVGGVVAAANEAVVATPGMINVAPLSEWVIELEQVAVEEFGALVTGEDAISDWFATAVERFRRQGAIAE